MRNPGWNVGVAIMRKSEENNGIREFFHCARVMYRIEYNIYFEQISKLTKTTEFGLIPEN